MSLFPIQPGLVTITRWLIIRSAFFLMMIQSAVAQTPPGSADSDAYRGLFAAAQDGDIIGVLR